jgi:hypothetical protein
MYIFIPQKGIFEGILKTHIAFIRWKVSVQCSYIVCTILHNAENMWHQRRCTLHHNDIETTKRIDIGTECERHNGLMD